MQASLIESAAHRTRYTLVGKHHEIAYWNSGHQATPPIADEWERDYDPSELFESERWIIRIFEPVRKNFFEPTKPGDPPAMQFMMPEKAIPADAEVAVLLGLHQEIGGPWKLVYVFKRLKCVHVYECVSQA